MMRGDLILDTTEISQWHTLVKEAESEYGCHLDEAMESYLVFTLMRFMKDQDLGTQAMALDYLRSHGLPDTLRIEQLRDIGDQCLLLSGLFPKRAEKRLVRVSYYVNMGRTAYHNISSSVQHGTAELYSQLADAFVLLMDLLQTIRRFNSPVLQPIQSYELWSDTGSQSAYKHINDTGTPIYEGLLNLKTRQ